MNTASAKSECEECEVQLFATRTCPNCAQAEKLLSEADIRFTKMLAEENPELAKKLGIRQAPTLVINNGNNVTKLAGLGAVRRFINDHARKIS